MNTNQWIEDCQHAENVASFIEAVSQWLRSHNCTVNPIGLRDFIFARYDRYASDGQWGVERCAGHYAIRRRKS